MTRTVLIEVSSDGVEKVSGYIDNAALLEKLRPLIYEFDRKVRRVAKAEKTPPSAQGS